MITDDINDFDLDDLQSRLKGALRALQSDLAGIRTGRASTALLDSIVVPAYGSNMPLDQLGTVNAPDARMLMVQVWDRSVVQVVEKAIRESGLGLNPQTEGQTIRLPIPELTGERRIELSKLARKVGEGGRIAVRNVRRDGIETIKKAQKSGSIGEDEAKAWTAEISELANKTIGEVDLLVQNKEKDIMG